MTISDFLVQDRMSSETDTEILHHKVFDVNIRLYNKKGQYHFIIQLIVKYMSKIERMEFTDYSKIKGISGANIGLAVNIIGVMRDKEMSFFLNPKITKKSDKTLVITSNCGSIRLSERIKVKRHKWVEIEYYDLDGKKTVRRCAGTFGYTVQHEIGHNLGILITDVEAN